MSIVNFRKLATINSIYRTGNIGAFTQSDVNLLKDKQIELYLDLRSSNELDKNISIEILKKEGIKYECFNMDNGEDSDMIIKPTYYNYAKYYLRFLETCKDNIAIFFIYLSNLVKEKIVYGCSLGKDRTGIISFLLLSCMGMNVDEIRQDYLLSNCLKYDKNVYSYFINNDKHDYISRLDKLDQIFELFYDQFAEKYGTVENYLCEIGVTKEIQEKIYVNYIGRKKI